MFNLEHMKSLVEATIQNAPEKEEPEVSMTMVESIDIPGEFGEDMCNYIDVAITESVADIYAYSADASSMLIESAISAATGNEEVQSSDRGDCCWYEGARCCSSEEDRCVLPGSGY